MDSEPYLIAGLGNPGRRYRENRHNVGFMLLDLLADHLRTSFRKMQSKALLTDSRWEGHKVLLVKPQTMMNLSGEAIGPLLRYYKVPLEHLVIVYDDLDLPPGSLRLRAAGGSGGHRGLTSIIQNIDSEAFPRLRIGIGRPPGRMDPADYVLQDFNQKERDALRITLKEGVECLRNLIKDGISIAMTRCNET